MLFAITSPMSFISLSSSNVAFAKLSIVLYFLANIFDALPPTCLMPNAVINLYKSFSLLALILSIKFCANFFPFFFSDAMSSNFNSYISDMLWINSLSNNCWIIFSPSPSIFIASLDTKWTKFLNNFAGHSIPVHLTAASPSSLTASAPHTGHTLGILKSFSSPVLFSSTTFTISGITSPAFWITTVSPIFKPFSFIKSSLCNVVFDIVEPATFTGSSIAIGVITPVLPTWHTMSFNIVCFCSGGYLYAIAHLGVFTVVPNISLNFKSSIFITAPSIPNVKSSLISPIFLIASFTSSIVSHGIRTGFTLNPSFSRYSSSSKCELNSFPSIFWTLNI